MARKQFILALTLLLGASPLLAAGAGQSSGTAAPAGTAQTRYCMHIEAITGSRLEKVKCWTREEWADKGVDVDQDWATEGVHTLG